MKCYNSHDIVQSQRKWKRRGIFLEKKYIYMKDNRVDLNCCFTVLLFFFAIDSMLRLDHDGDQLY